MINDLILFGTYFFISILFYFLGLYRKSSDIKSIENILKSAYSIMHKNNMLIAKKFKEDLQVISIENIKRIEEQNNKIIDAINTQITELNYSNETILEINKTLNKQSALYERIAMLQKIIVKKKNAKKA